jgi:hypothetical protein
MMDGCLVVPSNAGNPHNRPKSPSKSASNTGLGLYYGAALSYYGVLSAASAAARIQFIPNSAASQVRPPSPPPPSVEAQLDVSSPYVLLELIVVNTIA